MYCTVHLGFNYFPKVTVCTLFHSLCDTGNITKVHYSTCDNSLQLHACVLSFTVIESGDHSELKVCSGNGFAFYSLYLCP